MVVATMPWLSNSAKPNIHTLHFLFNDKPSAATLGILAFDAAKTMSSLLSLYRSLSDDQILHLRRHTLRSQGVAYLNSKDEDFLLNLAAAERLEELTAAAGSVSRLSRKCSNLGLSRFDLVGILHAGKMEFGSRSAPKLVARMEKLISSTAELHSAMESLLEMEASEKKLQKWRTFSPKQCPPVNFDLFDKKLVLQRKDVRHLKEISLWNQTFDFSVGLMTRLVCIIYARISAVFGPCIPDQSSPFDPNPCIRISRSGPLRKTGKMEMMKFPSRRRNLNDVGKKAPGSNRVYGLAPATTVGGCGLSMHYANVILFAERCLHTPMTIGEEARGELYEMLPARIKAMVRAKLQRNNWERRGEEEAACDGYSLAEGWREALEEMMGWLVPLAQDTVRWQTERNLEKQRFSTSPTALLIQTLHYSDLEKAEAAIVEVLVGLSCIYRYEKRRPFGRRS